MMCWTKLWQKFVLGFCLITFYTRVSCRQNIRSHTWPLTASISNYVPGSEASMAVCRSVAGLSRSQLELCQRRPDVIAAALDGLRLAVDECQHQFRWNRWNCSGMSTRNGMPRHSVVFQRGYRESAFAAAILSAGVAHSVARACSQGQLISCGCDPTSYRSSRQFRRNTIAAPQGHWKWGGCSHNLQYGVEFSRLFLDGKEQAGDIHSRISLHNSQAGRMAIANNMQIRCKCHGMSGSCELKTCWKTAPDFRQVGRILKNRFRSAVLVDQSNMGNGSPILLNRIRDRKRQKLRNKLKTDIRNNLNINGIKKRNKKKRDITTELLYYQKSPNFCEQDLSVDVPGTFGRQCNKTSTGSDGCASLCCGRGYNMIRRRRIERCNCKFHWCCKVECQNCTIEEWIPICK